MLTGQTVLPTTIKVLVGVDFFSLFLVLCKQETTIGGFCDAKVIKKCGNNAAFCIVNFYICSKHFI
jgi:hypothetical protein